MSTLDPDELLRRLRGKVRQEIPELTQDEAAKLVMMMTNIYVELLAELEAEFPGKLGFLKSDEKKAH